MTQLSYESLPSPVKTRQVLIFINWLFVAHVVFLFFLIGLKIIQACFEPAFTGFLDAVHRGLTRRIENPSFLSFLSLSILYTQMGRLIVLNAVEWCRWRFGQPFTQVLLLFALALVIIAYVVGMSHTTGTWFWKPKDTDDPKFTPYPQFIPYVQFIQSIEGASIVAAITIFIAYASAMTFLQRPATSQRLIGRLEALEEGVATCWVRTADGVVVLAELPAMFFLSNKTSVGGLFEIPRGMNYARPLKDERDVMELTSDLGRENVVEYDERFAESQTEEKIWDDIKRRSDQFRDFLLRGDWNRDKGE